MKQFIKKNWTWILVALYVISPDLVPGPLDDVVLIFAEITRRSVLWLIKKIRR
jgi:hypothetical protein